jgi:S-adenosylmethionine:tRNA ribosyltransferase-isomerase
VIAATAAVQRPDDARLLVVDAHGVITHRPRRDLIELLRSGDLVVANDAATLPASLHGIHEPSGRAIEIRLAGRDSLDPDAIADVIAVLFGEGDFHQRTEDRQPPPAVAPGDQLRFATLNARVVAHVGHERLIRIRFEGTAAEIWSGLARDGRPIQYSHLAEPLAIWDSWTPIAGAPVAFEPPSAGFALDWRLIHTLATRDIRFATLTHAAGISSTGDAELDARLPFDEAYVIPASTARLVAEARAQRHRIVAVGTSVVRALEHAACATGVVSAGEGMATGRIGAHSRLRVVDALLSGTHDPETSHYQLLRAFVADDTLARIDRELNRRRYRTHEFGDSLFIQRNLRIVLDV